MTLFAPDGTLVLAALDDFGLEELNPFVATPTGDCIVARFKRIRSRPSRGGR